MISKEKIFKRFMNLYDIAQKPQGLYNLFRHYIFLILWDT